MNIKQHKKMYKAGKQWLVASLMAIAAGLVMGTTVHADTTTVNQAAQQTSTAQVIQQPQATANTTARQAAAITPQVMVILIATQWHLPIVMKTLTCLFPGGTLLMQVKRNHTTTTLFMTTQLTKKLTGKRPLLQLSTVQTFNAHTRI